MPSQPLGNPSDHPLWSKIQATYRLKEEEAVKRFFDKTLFNDSQQENVEKMAVDLIAHVRRQKPKSLSIEGFLQMHQLSSQEGLALMSLAEALLRIPDKSTKNHLIREKVSEGDWSNKEDDSFLTRLANFGLLTTSKILNFGLGSHKVIATLTSLIRRFGEPVIRQIMAQAMKIMSQQFITGETMTQALKRATTLQEKGYRYSYDMLGEAARTHQDALRYLESYQQAITEIAATVINDGKTIYDRPGLSVKLTALHPRFKWAQKDRVFSELVPVLVDLCQQAKRAGISITIDAEESDRLELSLKVIEQVFAHPDLQDWEGLGLAVQAYQKRAPAVIDWLVDLAKTYQKRLGIRLVKGAYWDSEIKRTQENGLTDYPVYTQKVYTDVSYLACADQLLQSSEWIYPQFATHNAYTLAAVYQLAQKYGVTKYEFQRLQGMGEPLYQQITENSVYAVPCRIYAPVGAYRDLLAYLVRRLLENGANSSFVNQIYDPVFSLEQLTANPFLKAEQLQGHPHPKIPLPKDLLLPSRPNSEGIDLSDSIAIKELEDVVQQYTLQPIETPDLTDQQLERVLDLSCQSFDKWRKLPVEERARILERLGELFQQNMSTLIALLVKEAHKTLEDGVAEVREAIDFCTYYANQARFYQKQPVALPGPTGELNQLSYQGRGVFVCISPWNFPLAIFVGQVIAALVAGNTVIAKAAASTPQIAKFAVELAYQAGIPKDVLHLITIPGSQLSDGLLSDPRIAGVAFTGSTETARHINQVLAAKPGLIVPFIAETGGINAMIVDSSALWEQVVDDVITSAFHSAGQRCSCLRLLLVQHEVADEVLTMLEGAMAELKLGDPGYLSTDVGPVIDKEAYDSLTEYVAQLEQSTDTARLLYRCEIPTDLADKNYMAPQIWQLSSAKDLTQEIFGPILHVVKYRGEHLDQVIKDINAKNFGLTLGLHTRLETTVQQVCSEARVGNIYVNRHMTGAVVGVQPFGGQGLSGTGFKAGGPNYLLRFMVEVAFSQNTTASGGNASLLASV